MRPDFVELKRVRERQTSRGRGEEALATLLDATEYELISILTTIVTTGSNWANRPSRGAKCPHPLPVLC